MYECMLETFERIWREERQGSVVVTRFLRVGVEEKNGVGRRGGEERGGSAARC